MPRTRCGSPAGDVLHHWRIPARIRLSATPVSLPWNIRAGQASSLMEDLMSRSRAGASLLALGLMACGGPVAFQGENTLKITGESPPPVVAPAPEPPRV